MATKILLSAVAAALVAAVVVPAAGARPQTTTPGVVYVVKVVLTDKAIAIAHDKFTRNAQIRYPRGALIRYSVLNKGTHPYVFRVWGSNTAVIKPGARDSILINWNYRGRFAYEILLRGKPAGPKGSIIIF
jgi:hypothetical protein